MPYDIDEKEVNVMQEQTEKITIPIAICDDDPIVLEQLCKLTRQTLDPYYRIELYAADSAEALRLYDKVFSIVVLDIQLPRDSGIELARDLIAEGSPCRVIFVSGFVNYVSEVYDVPHLCMVLKEHMQEQLPRFLLRAAATVAAESGQTLILRSMGKNKTAALSQILYMERQGHNTYLYLRDGSVVHSKEKLSSLQDRIGSPHFFRCHISYCVNLKHIGSVQGRELTMANGQVLPVSRPNLKPFKEAYFRYLGDIT